MTVVRMAQPLEHPVTGVLYFRIAIPKALRPFAKGGKTEPRHEYKRSLHTKDRRVAKRLYADASSVYADYVRTLEARKAAAERAAAFIPMVSSDSPPSAAGPTDLRSLADAFAGAFLEAHHGRPAPAFARGKARSLPPGAWGDPSEPWARQRYLLAMDKRAPVSTAHQLEFIAEPAKGFLSERGITLSEAEWAEFGELVCGPFDDVLEALQKHARGEVPAVPLVERIAMNAPESRPKVSIRVLVDVWARGQARVRPRTREKFERRLRQLSEFVGHDDANAVNSDHLMKWRDHLKAKGLSAKTIEDDSIGIVRTAFRAARSARVLPTDPFIDYVPLKRDSAKGDSRHPYSASQTVTVLQAARKETGALRWLGWLGAYTGARVGELAALGKADVKAERGVQFLRITDDGTGGKSVKTRASVRDVPIHRGLIAEGFLEFVAAAKEGPLFPELRLSKYGTRADHASDKYMHWLRNVVVIKDPLIVHHSWRHRMEDELREIDTPSEVAAAITGRATQGSRGAYGHGVSLTKKADWMGKLPTITVGKR